MVKAPGEPIDLRGSGHSFSTIDTDVTAQNIETGLDGGTQLGKRYVDESLGLDLLCTRADKSSISVDNAILGLKPAKALPASDYGALADGRVEP